MEKGIKIDPRHGLVEIKHKSILHSNELLVLADQSQQVYYSRVVSLLITESVC